MLSEKPWKLESTLLLASGIMLCLSLGTALGMLLPIVFPQSKGEPGFIHFLLGTASFQGAALVLIHFFLKQHEITWRELLGLDQLHWKRAVGIGLALGVVVLPLALILSKLSHWLLTLMFDMEPEKQVAVTIIEKISGWDQRVSVGIAAVLLAPLVEEILFRGILYPLLKQRSHPVAAMLASSLLFGVIHFNLLTFLPLVFLALTLVLVYEQTGSLVAPITTHAFFNAVNYALLLVAPKWTS